MAGPLSFSIRGCVFEAVPLPRPRRAARTTWQHGTAPAESLARHRRPPSKHSAAPGAGRRAARGEQSAAGAAAQWQGHRPADTLTEVLPPQAMATEHPLFLAMKRLHPVCGARVRQRGALHAAAATSLSAWRVPCCPAPPWFALRPCPACSHRVYVCWSHAPRGGARSGWRRTRRRGAGGWRCRRRAMRRPGRRPGTPCRHSWSPMKTSNRPHSWVRDACASPSRAARAPRPSRRA